MKNVNSKKKINLDLSEFIGLELLEVHSNLFLFDEGCLELDCPWRVRNGLIYLCPQVIESKLFREEAQGIVNKNLIGKTIKIIRIFDMPCDLEIVFNNDHILEVFPVHPLFESWNLRKNQGRNLVGVPGGKISWFLKNGES